MSGPSTRSRLFIAHLRLVSERDRITPPEQGEILVAMAKCSNRLQHFQRMLLFSTESKRPSISLSLSHARSRP
jgi:hypothetical protein